MVNRFVSMLRHMALGLALLGCVPAYAIRIDFVAAFQSPPLFTADGNWLTGQLWTNVPANTDSLAQAQAIIGCVHRSYSLTLD